MEELKENITYKKDVELLSEEVQEVMNRIPSAVVRWGMTVMAVIVACLLLMAAYLPWPETIERSFEGHLEGSKAEIYVSLPSEYLKLVPLLNNKNVILYSAVLPEEYAEKGIAGVINNVIIENTINGYTTRLYIELTDLRFYYPTSEFSGKIILITNKSSLFQRIMNNIKVLNL